MINKTQVLPRLLLATLATALVLPAKTAVAQGSSLAETMPSGAVAFAEVSGLGRVIDRLQDSDYLETVREIPQLQGIFQSRQYRRADAGRKILETQLGMDVWTAGKKLLGGRVGLAAYPRPGEQQPNLVAVVRVADAKALARLRERIDPILVLLGEQIDRSDAGNGFELIAANGNAFVAMSDEWVTASNSRDLLNKTLSLLSGKGKSSLAEDDAFKLISRQMGSDHLGRVYVNAGVISKMTGGRFGLPEKMDNPLFSLLVGGILELAVRSPYGGLTLDLEDEEFVLTAGVAGKPKTLGTTYSPFFSEYPESGTRPIPKPPELIGGFTIYRDFAGWYGNREELLQPQLLPGFDQFEAGLANLLPGRDFSEDVLPLIGKNFTFLAAPQDYSHLDGEPGVKLPGFAIILELNKPEEGAEIFHLFFQTFSSILNIQAGQQGRQPWLLKSETYKDVQITFGRYLKKPKGERLPLVFNFMPASARVEDNFIISSSISLCRALIDELKKPENKKPVDKNLNFEFYFGPLADILDANGEFFQTQRIQQGRTPDEAKQDVTTVLTLLRYFKSLEFSTTASGETFRVQLKGSWK